MQATTPLSQMTRQELMDYLAAHPSECQEGHPVFQELLHRPPDPEEIELVAQFHAWYKRQFGEH